MGRRLRAGTGLRARSDRRLVRDLSGSLRPSPARVAQSASRRYGDRHPVGWQDQRAVLRARLVVAVGEREALLLPEQLWSGEAQVLRRLPSR